MTDRALLITHLLNEIIETLPKNIDVYLFGSYMYSSTANDIDILVIYREPNTPFTIISLKKTLGEFFKEKIQIDTDICFLSDVEAKNNSFLSDEHCIKIASN